MNTLTIGRNIKRLREEQNITQQMLAEKLSISFQAVSKWETGTSLPDVTLLPAISEIFGVTIDDLFRANIHAASYLTNRRLSVYKITILC